MSSQNNNNNSGVAFGMALVAAGLIALAALVFFAACFLAFVFTIVVLLAWNRPFSLGKLSITPEEARAFVYRGLAGAVALPAFAIFCVIVFGIPLNPDVWPYLVLGGYAGGSVGIEWWMAQAEGEAAPTVQIIPPQPQLPAPPSAPSPVPTRTPFRFASWDDEEAGR